MFKDKNLWIYLLALGFNWLIDFSVLTGLILSHKAIWFDW